MKIQEEFNIDKVICDIDVRYYINCSFSKDNGQTWEEDFSKYVSLLKIAPSDPSTDPVIFTRQLTGYEYEVEEAAAALSAGQTECTSMPWEETLHIMRLMDDLRGQMGVKYPFE